jgi:hypothetical protein
VRLKQDGLLAKHRGQINRQPGVVMWELLMIYACIPAEKQEEMEEVLTEENESMWVNARLYIFRKLRYF